MKPSKKPSPLLVVVALAGLLLGSVLTYGAIYSDFQKENPPVHFHANFALFINGKQFDFSSKQYMEDIGSCSVSGNQAPRDRVHLHNSDGGAIHVHAPQVTWADFFANVGFAINASSIVTNDGTTYTANGTQQIRFVLNGKVVPNPLDTYIKSEDRLLINYGDQSNQILATSEYLSVPATAHRFNTQDDPATCTGSMKRPYTFKFWDVK